MDDRHRAEATDVQRDTGMTITFADGYVAEFDLMTLRLGCACAACRGLRERGQDVWPLPTSPVPLRIDDAELHGAWAIRFTWNDGHFHRRLQSVRQPRMTTSNWARQTPENTF